MLPIEQLPDPQREVLRQLFFSTGHQATAAELADRCYYPDPEVYDALFKLEQRGYVASQPCPDEFLRYRPTADVLAQMQQLNVRDTAPLVEAMRKAAENLKRFNDENPFLE